MPKVDPSTVEEVFGGRTRTQILGFLAQSATPVTGYALARALSASAANVYGELRRLEASGVVARRPDARGNSTFELADEDLRRFLKRRVRVLSSVDWFSPSSVSSREALSERAESLTLKPHGGPARLALRPFREEFRRPAAKDRALRRIRRAQGQGR